MSILIDVNQIAIGILVNNVKDNSDYDMNMIRHTIISRFLDIRAKFAHIYGDIVLCYDSNTYWRKTVFPNYKGTRKKDREESSVDWSEVFNISNLLRDEFKEFLPFKILCIQDAEADDIIASITKYRSFYGYSTLIVSGDKDFKQLQQYENVDIYNPQTHEITKTSPIDALSYLKEHVIRGDRSDGIPNILSDDNCLMDKVRQKPITKKFIAKWMNETKFAICEKSEQMLYNYNRNEQLIDFVHIPNTLIKDIVNAYKVPVDCNKDTLYQYLDNNRLDSISNRFSVFI